MFTGEVIIQLSEITRASSQAFVISFILGPYCFCAPLEGFPHTEFILLLDQCIQERLQKAHGVTQM